ncbi:1,2-dihydroxy-3-keto-5-methylthiopentene dioxygenase [Polyrhizophydium stewartii]|uniref:Acireductone dioxygenase n=1 Tax=Polyrhizophydium stewartii TaxID=2732419 RepID=A0ABR4NFZ6_9FUNG|nr:1,2-dihydroxy-3-keto-5-methylthiopentene dioxygenase [Polyrhizophydium stewartii]
MVTAWFYADSDADPREPHQYEPNREVSLDELARLGVLHWTFDPDTELDKVNELAAQRKYVSRDEVNIARDTLPNYDEKLKTFFTEHIHDDEEIRYILAGSGYFDVRDEQDRWVRINTKKGDMIILPAGSYHRFILDTNNYLKAMRLFKEDPKWTPINRSEETDKHERRVEYLEALKKAAAPAAAAVGKRASPESDAADAAPAETADLPAAKKLKDEAAAPAAGAADAQSEPATATAAE